MKKLTNLLFIVTAFLSACQESDVVIPRQPVQEIPVTVAEAVFQNASGIMNENDPNQNTISVALSKAAPAEGTLTIKLQTLNSTYGVDFVTSPSPVNGEISLPVAKGATSVNFMINSIQNSAINNARSIQFVMDRATGGITVKSNDSYSLVINDDELSGRLKKYESVAGSWRAIREYSYSEQGNVKEINWSTFTPSQLRGTYNYQYENGKVVRMTDKTGETTYYYWQGDRVTKSEKFDLKSLKQRIEYGYDEAGNVGEMVFYDRQPDGTIQRSIVMIFLYYQDGNIYKKLTYYGSNEEELTLSSTQTFENYLDKPNPSPMVETLPHLNPQRNLPRSYRYETNDQVLDYQIQYQFRQDGLLMQRNVTDGKVTETTTYTYY